MWNSIEFSYLAKYEVVLEYFNDSATKYHKKHRGDDDKLLELWDVILEFVSLKYPNGAISHKLRSTLVETTLIMYEHLVKKCKTNPNRAISSLNALVNHSQMINFFNTNPAFYGYLSAAVFRGTIQGVTSKTTTLEEVKSLLASLKDFTHYNVSNVQYKDAFKSEILVPLSELVIVCSSNGLNVEKEYFNTLTTVFFNPESVPYYKEQFKKSENGFFNIIQEQHVCLMMMEGFMVAYQKENDLMAEFYQFMFEKFFTSTTDFSKQSHGLVHVLHLLKKFNVSVHLPVGDKTVLSLISETITSSVADNSRNHTLECINLINHTIRLNPLILEHHIVKIASQFMLIKKTTKDLKIYAEFLCLVIEMFRKLSRFEKMISKLLDAVKIELNNVKVTKKLKRKLIDELPAGKVRKLNESLSVDVSAMEVDENDEIGEENHFMLLLKSKYEKEDPQHDFLDLDWDDLVFAWPNCVSSKFIQNISTLVSNTSLMIWKTFIFTIDDCLQNLEEKGCDENSVFYLQFTSYLLCQYLTGCPLVEQADKNWSQIEERIALMKEKLQKFSKTMLSLEHNSKVMGSFLNLCLKLGSFELIHWYYRPDSIRAENEEHSEQFPDLKRVDFSKNAKQLYGYLPNDEWTLLEQRIVNFGKDQCKSRINAVNLLKLKGMRLFDKNVSAKKEKNVISDILSEFIQAKSVFLEKSTNQMFISTLDRKQKIDIINSILEDDEEWQSKFSSILDIEENIEIVELAAIVCYKKISENIGSKKALISKIDYNQLLIDGILCFANIEDKFETFKPNSVETFSLDEINQYVEFLKQLPVGFLHSDMKNTVYALNSVLLADLQNCTELKSSLLEITVALTELGSGYDCFKNIDLQSHLKLFSDFKANSAHFEIIINTLTKFSSDSNLTIAKKLVDLLGENTDTMEDLILISADRFSVSKKHNKVDKDFQEMKSVLSQLIFEKSNSGEGSLKGFISALNMYFQTTENQKKENEELGKTCLNFLKNKREDDVQLQIQLLAITLSHLVPLKIKLEDLESMLDDFWTAMKKNSDLESLGSKLNKDITNLISLNYSTDKYMKLLKEIQVKANEEQSIDQMIVICRLLQNFAESRLPKGKGMLFSEYCKQILFQIVMRFVLKETSILNHPVLIVEVLKCYSSVTKNVQVLMSESLFNDVLSFPLDVNIKRFKVTENNIDEFKELHRQITTLCHNVVQYRSTSLRHVVPQFVTILKDLVHSICAYRNERTEETRKLTENEISILADLAHGLEQVFDAMANKSKTAKKVAPFLLVYVINEMIFNTNSTTLYPNVRN